MSATHDRWIWAGAAGLGALVSAGAVGEWRHTRKIAADPEHPVLRSPPAGAPLEVTSSDGTILHVEVFGSERDGSYAGAPIVLVHGWTEQLSYWIYVIRELSARGFRIVAYDLRGHGKSTPAAGGDYSLARFGEDLEAVLQIVVGDDQRAVVAGHSLGAMSIAAWAERHEVEKWVGAAALLNTGVGDLIAEQLLLRSPRIAHSLNQAIARRGFLGARTPLPRFSTSLSYTAIRYIAFGLTATPAQVAFYERMLVTCPADVRASAGIAMSEMDLHDAVPRLNVPTVVIAGADDKLTPPSHARRIAGLLPQLENLIVLEETGHMAPLERPRDVNEVLARLSLAIAPGASVAAA